MNTLKYTTYRDDGIFGEFTFDGQEEPFMVTLSHAYKQDDGTYQPIVKTGIYNCIRGIHHLHDPLHPGQLVSIDTFEIIGIIGHSGLLFPHSGNWNKDSDGCTLCGDKIVVDGHGEWMITNSRATYHSFMAQMGDSQSFMLRIV